MKTEKKKKLYRAVIQGIGLDLSEEVDTSRN